jgi:hypothetical protein
LSCAAAGAGRPSAMSADVMAGKSAFRIVDLPVGDTSKASSSIALDRRPVMSQRYRLPV